jgi:hypothetical protein
MQATHRRARGEVFESSRAHACIGARKTPQLFDQTGTSYHAAARASVIINRPWLGQARASCESGPTRLLPTGRS